ncbi:hypothetical protein DENSPDRAFT_768177 [Dentipellis sp. KUC8613]|nr:hypothetical protein DENSPDRAFT_768177 [Dentipellis sp. KUC8613]
MPAIPSIIQPLGPSRSTCGYCSPPGRRSDEETSAMEAGLVPVQLSCEAGTSVYQKMIDRGWRRSGTYCYKPDLKRSCCPQYTIKLDALEFKPSKSQRKLINRWNRYVRNAEGKGEQGKGSDHKGSALVRMKKADRQSDEPPSSGSSFVSSIHASEKQFLPSSEAEPAQVFEVTLEPSSFTEEKFALYESYEANIHSRAHVRRSGFKSFLIESPLRREPIMYARPRPAHLPTDYGAYHQLYRLNGKLIAMGVIDILPSCVSSVYFMWEKSYEHFSLGKLSALREAALAREIHDAGVPQMGWLYMGFYIHTCQKMRYKGEYSPSYLADPEEFTWHPITDCKRLLDVHRYACFAHPEHSITGPAEITPEGMH